MNESGDKCYRLQNRRVQSYEVKNHERKLKFFNNYRKKAQGLNNYIKKASNLQGTDNFTPNSIENIENNFIMLMWNWHKNVKKEYKSTNEETIQQCKYTNLTDR